MGRVGNKDLLARTAFGFVMRAHHQQAGELAVSPGGRLQRDRIHTGDFEETVAESFNDAQRALRNLLWLVRMTVGNSLKARDHFIHTRVVLHSARAERIHTEIDGVIPGG